MKDLVIVNPEDNVAIAVNDLVKNQIYDFITGKIKLSQDASAGNKIALKNLTSGAIIVKAGYPIGKLVTSVKAGDIIDSQNLRSLSSKELVSYKSKPKIIKNVKDDSHEKTFMGYRRKNGKVGIRNDLYIVPTVGCITPLMDIMVQEFKANHPNNGSFDNIILLKHPYGCSQLGDDFAQTRQILCDAITHPNVGGVLVFGLGCENNQMDGMKEQLQKMGGIDSKRMKFLVAQQVKDEFAVAQKMLEELNDEAANDKREPVSINELKIGVQDTRPDEFSVLTSNRLLGSLTDFISNNGGSIAMTGYPSLSSEKEILINRASSDKVADDIEKSFEEYEKYNAQFDEPLVPNLTDLDKKIGISTENERTANALQKIGNASITAAVPYGEKLPEKGLNIIYSPDNDLIDNSTSASADCQMVIVSTGKGTPYASYVPTVKVSSTHKLAEKKSRWIDFDGGKVLDESLEDVSDEFIDYILEVASGKETNNEKMGLHGLAIFKMGVTE